jgi:26S proteasome regulatory subunit N2
MWLFSETLYEDESFPERQLAALVLAKVYYHLQEYNESMTFALDAGDLFKLDKEGEFEETIISKCIDTYINVSASRNLSPPEKARDVSLPTLATTFGNLNDPDNTSAGLTSPTTPFSQSTLPSKSLLSRQNTLEVPVQEGMAGSTGSIPDRLKHRALEKVIERLFEACLREGRYRQVVGIAVEARNLEVLRRVIKRASDDEKKSSGKQADSGASLTDELMEYVLDICMSIVQERGLRTEILKLILDLLSDIPAPDYFSIAKCAVYLNQDEEASRMLKKLVVCIIYTAYGRSRANHSQSDENQNSTAIAYQIAFDLYDNGTQEFLAKVIKSLPAKVEEAPEDPENRKLTHIQSRWSLTNVVS